MSSCPFGSQNINNRVFRFELFSIHLPLWYRGISTACLWLHDKRSYFDRSRLFQFGSDIKNVLAPFWLMECQSTQCTHKSFTIMWGKTVEKLVTLVLPNKTISLTNNFQGYYKKFLSIQISFEEKYYIFYSYSFSSDFMQAMTIDKPSTLS